MLPEALSKNEGIEQIEAHMLNFEQADCPVAHHFGPGIYVREVTLPAGIIALGHEQKYEHLNIMLTGKVAIIDGGKVRVLVAPMIFVGKPGRKIGYVIETCVWQNVYATDETDIDKLEAHYLNKSETWIEHDKNMREFKSILRQEDRDDFYSAIEEYGFSIETVKAQSENEHDQIDMPSPWSSIVSVRESDIHGRGLFLTSPVEANQIIAPARIGGMRTPAGRFVNHSKVPNCKFVINYDDDNIYLLSLVPIDGCCGGSNGQELTVDYRQSLELIGCWRKTCLE